MKVNLTLYVHSSVNSWDENKFCVFSFDATKLNTGYLLVGTMEVEYEVPADWNPTAAEVLALEAEKRRLSDEFNAKVRTINDRLSKLQAIEFNPSEVV